MCGYKKQNKGFTLLELSIVILIIGFLIGSFIAGDQLIFMGKVRQNVTEMQNYKTTVKIFKDKFGVLPGDMSNASTVLGCTPASAAPAGCNGNGNNQINNATSPLNQGAEPLRAWQHLSLSGLIPTSFPGTTSVANQYVVGENTPASAIEPGGYFLNYVIIGGHTTEPFTYLIQGNSGTGALNTASSTPAFAKALDEKIDDGLPKVGNLLATNTGGTCYTTATGSASTYIVTTTTLVCRVGLMVDKTL